MRLLERACVRLLAASLCVWGRHCGRGRHNLLGRQRGCCEAAAGLSQALQTAAAMLAQGYGLVRFTSAQDAQAAIEKFHGTELEGRTLTVRLDKCAACPWPVQLSAACTLASHSLNRLPASPGSPSILAVMRMWAGSPRAARAQVCIVEQLRARRGRQGGQLRAAAGRPAVGLCGCAAALGGAGGHSEVDSAHGETTASGSLEKRLSLTWRTRVALNDRLTLDRPPLACLNATALCAI